MHRHADILTNAGVSALVTVPEARTVANLLKSRVPNLRHIWSAAELAQGEHLKPLGSPPSAESIAMLQYTSGSTGAPKGVMLTHANLLANIRSIGTQISVAESDIFVSWLPLYHDMGLIGARLTVLWLLAGHHAANGVPDTADALVACHSSVSCHAHRLA